jgi:hypothetical protein
MYGKIDTIGFPTILTKILACIPIDRIRNRYNIHQGHLPLNIICCCSRSSKSVSWKLSGSSLSMRRLTCQKETIYTKINETEQQTEEIQYDDAMAR